MTRLVKLHIFQSLDGYAQARDGEFIPPPWSEQMDDWAITATRDAGAILFGRVTYEELGAYWTAAPQDASLPPPMQEVARLINAAEKYGFSKSLTQATWNNSTILRGALGVEVERLKAKGSGDLVIFGSPTLAHSFMQRDLIDEYRILVGPQVYGGGKTFMGDGRTFDLELVEAVPFDTGAVQLVYRPSR